jgi:uncharacterized YccA/Bax inhibitor family protein
MPKRSEPLLLVLVLARVGLILVIWLAIFLAMFLGYFTVPILMVGGLAVIYSLADLGLYVALKRQAKTDQMRHQFLRDQSRAEEPDPTDK